MPKVKLRMYLTWAAAAVVGGLLLFTDISLLVALVLGALLLAPIFTMVRD